MARDTAAEIAEIKARASRSPNRHSFALSMLNNVWAEGGLDAAPEFVVIRLVTILESFTRSWITQMIDHGEPYVTRALELSRSSLKIDLNLTRALVGQRLTIGELIAHTVSVNSIENIEGIFSKTIGEKLFIALTGVCDRWEVEIRGAAPVPIIKDVDFVRSQMASLFEERHILVHELPLGHHCRPDAVDAYLRAVNEFVKAGDQAFSTLLGGHYPLTQAAMNEAAAETAAAADQELDDVVIAIDPSRADEEFLAAQEAWESYRRLHSAYRSGVNRPNSGSIAPLLYASAYEKITRARIMELRWFLEREEGDL